MRISDVSLLQVPDAGGRRCSWMDNHRDERETYEDPITGRVRTARGAGHRWTGPDSMGGSPGHVPVRSVSGAHKRPQVAAEREEVATR
jgi:hypothetical protein